MTALLTPEELDAAVKERPTIDRRGSSWE